MAEQKTLPDTPSPKLSMSNTKKEMIDAYNALLRQFEEKDKAALRPEKKLEERKKSEVVGIAASLSTEGVAKELNNLKLEINNALAQIADRLEKEVQKFQSVQQAIEFKEKDFQEVYEIERTAASLAALIETQNQKRLDFETEMAARRQQLDREILTLRAEWERENKEHDAQIRERDAEEKKSRDRQKENFAYEFEREKRLATDKFQEEKANLEKTLRESKEQAEKSLLERERAVAAREHKLNELEEAVQGFTGEIEAAVTRAVKDATERLKAEAKNREELLKKEYDGERNVLTTRIASLEKTVEQQNDQIAKLSQQIEAAYQKVQDIALKAVEGSSAYKSLTSLQQILSEQARGAIQEK
ncbi:MAG: hypothetical protein ACFCVA_13890 [Gammaproteobacteria bacterium]